MDFVVRAATTAALSALQGLQTIDGVQLRQNDLVLVKDQAGKNQNAVYFASTGPWLVHPAFTAGVPVGSVRVECLEGSVNAACSFRLKGVGLARVPFTFQEWVSESATASLPPEGSLGPDDLDNARIVHVSKDGSDELGNGTSGAPFASIQKGVDFLGPPVSLDDENMGRVIIIGPGDYREDVVIGPGGQWRFFFGGFLTVDSLRYNLDTAKQFGGFPILSLNSRAGIGASVSINNDLIIDDSANPGSRLTCLIDAVGIGGLDTTGFTGSVAPLPFFNFTNGFCGGNFTWPGRLRVGGTFTQIFGDLTVDRFTISENLLLFGDLSAPNGFNSATDRFRDCSFDGDVNFGGNEIRADGNTIGLFFENGSTLSGSSFFRIVGGGPPRVEVAGVPTSGVGGDDERDGYVTGLVWINTLADDAYVCAKQTFDASVWRGPV